MVSAKTIKLTITHRKRRLDDSSVQFIFDPTVRDTLMNFNFF